MYSFSESSADKLGTVHQDLQVIFNEVIKHRDITVTDGKRTTKQQQALYAQGRTTAGDIVTHADGVTNKSNHQSARAVDVVPYPEMWSSKKELDALGHFVLGVAAVLKRYGAIEHNIEWGGMWSFVDRPHYQLK